MLVFVFGSVSQGGILDILKSGPETSPEQLVWQRVAFIGEAKVQETRGKVERLTGIEQWSPLQAGAVLLPGDVIRAHLDGTALLQMRESGSLVKLTPATLLRLTTLQPGWDEAILTGREQARGFCVRGVRGQAHFQVDGSDWRRVEVSTVLAPATLVRTATGSSLDLFDTRNGHFVRVEGGTQVRLNKTLSAERQYQNPAIAATSPVPPQR